MNEKDRAGRILKILRDNYPIPKRVVLNKDTFHVLIRTILSQATNDRNRDRAYRSLSNKYEITPQALAAADIKEIGEAIRVGGLYRNKSRKIKELSKFVLEHFHGTLDFIYREPLDVARSRLMEIPGVGPKTADVVLLFSADKPTLPVDTHVNRVSKRLGLAPIRADYEEIRESVESLYSPEEYLPVHLLLISLGRTYCRARNPTHLVCPVNSQCPTAQRERLQPDLHRFHGSRDYP